MKKINFYSLMLLALAFIGLTFTSCGDDTPEVLAVMGCMDEDGDNYDVTVTEDDGSCLYTELYTGSYTVAFECAVLPFSSADLSVTRAGDDMLQFLITSETLPFPVPVTATIASKDMLTAVQDLDEIDLSALNPMWAGLLFNINVDGTFDRSETGVISGPITFTLVESTGLVPDPIVDTCNFTATPI